MTIKAIAFLAIALGGASAWAQRGAGPRVEYRRTTVITITDDDPVEGEFDRPGGDVVSTLRPLRHVSLVKMRADFLPELRKSAEQVD